MPSVVFTAPFATGRERVDHLSARYMGLAAMFAAQVRAPKSSKRLAARPAGG